MYMFAYDNREMPRSLSLLKFDFSTEKSQLVPLPYKCHQFQTISLCVVREEKLCVLLRREKNSKTEIWVTNKIDDEKNTKVVSWSKVLALDLIPSFHLSDDLSFMLDEEKKVVIFIDRLVEEEYESKDMLHIVGEDDKKPTIVDSRLDTYGGCWPAILDYVPSLVHIDQAGRKRERETLIRITNKLIAIEAGMMESSESLEAGISILVSCFETIRENLVSLLRELASSSDDDERKTLSAVFFFFFWFFDPES